MIHRIKALGLALVALAALGALMASVAQAGRIDVPGRENAVITAEREGTKNHVFQIPEDPAVECTIATLEGTLHQAPEIKELKEATLTATYEGCTAGGFAAQVRMNGCKYTLTGESNEVDPELTAWVDVTGCTTGKHIEIRVPSIGCTITVFEANTLSHIVFNDVTGSSPTHARAQATVGSIPWQQDGTFCPRGNGTQGVNAEFTGETTVKAFEDKGTDLVTKHEHQYTEHTCGLQVGLVVT
jgi:hypothetical protein